MKTAKSLLIKLFVAAAMLLLANQSHALTTPYMTDLSNQLSFYHSQLTNSPLLDHKKEARALAVALRDLKRPTTSVAQDYDRFFLAVLHLGNYAFTDLVLVAGGNVVSSNFIYDAAVKIGELSARTNALNRFVVTRNAASRQIDQAFGLLLINIATSGDTSKTNQQAALLRGRRIFSKLVLAERLVVRGEARQGFAPTVLEVGSTLAYTNRAESGTITIKISDEYEDANVEQAQTLAGSYSYVRTGLNTGTLILTEFGPDGSVTTHKVTFRTGTAGSYTSLLEQGAVRKRSAGRFTFTAALPPG